MSEIAVRAENLSKVYTLYPTPWARMRDIFGWKRRGGAEFPTHTAIDGMDLEIRFGEKVGFIGRNGAGKSTLLKLITGVIEPTGGRLEINGDTHALLQMGAGFHQDFTGRENAYGYLANLGLTGERADVAVDEIIEFSELEEYIDQPLKTYSTGMAMRLIFAASTTVAPKLFVVDEVLGVGDAYFQQKSFARIQEMVTKNQTTLLLVSHDIYSTARICERIVWIDRGRIKFDGNPKTALNLYESSIKEQEEQRLAKRHRDAIARNKSTANDVVFCSLKPVEVEGRETSFAVGPIRATWEGGESDGSPVLNEAECNWGEEETIDGRTARRFCHFGSVFRKLSFLISGSGIFAQLSSETLRFRGELHADAPIDIRVVAAHPVSFREYGGLLKHGGTGWECIEIVLEDLGSQASSEEPVSRRYGTRHFEIMDVQFLDARGEEAHLLKPLQDLTIRMSYRINDPDFDERPVLVFAFQKDGTMRSHRFWTSDIRLSAKDGMEGQIEVTASPFLLGAGTYLVTSSVFREGYFSGRNKGKFFSINDDILDMHARSYEIEVMQDSSNPLINDVIFHHPAVWRANTLSLKSSSDPSPVQYQAASK